MSKLGKRKLSLSRRDFYTFINLAALIAAFIFRIPLGFMAGNKGVAYFGAANEIFIVLAGTISYGLSEATAALVRYRVKREPGKSAEKILRSALAFGGSAGLIFSIILGFFGHFLADKVMNVPLAGLSVRLMAPAIFFFILTGIFKGYFQGHGSGAPAMQSQVLYAIFLFAGGLIGAGIWKDYGEKVSALLQNENFTSAYGAMGASIGLLSASVFCFLHVLLLYVIFRHSHKKQGGLEEQKIKGSDIHTFYTLLGNSFMHSMLWLCYHILPLLDQYLFFGFFAGAGDRADMWGAYYGKCLMMTGTLGVIIHMMCILPVRRIITSLERREHSLVKDRMGALVHQCTLFAVPAAIFQAVLAENILTVLPAGNSGQTAVWMQLGSIALVFSVFAVLFIEILIRIRKIRYVIAMGALALVFHILCAFLLVKTAKMGMTGIIIAVIVFYAVVAILGLLLLSRILGYRQEWLRSFAFTIAAAALSGFIAFILNRVLFSLIGGIISMLVCLAVAIPLYMIILVVLRTFKDGELEEITGGRIFIMLSELLHFS